MLLCTPRFAVPATPFVMKPAPAACSVRSCCHSAVKDFIDQGCQVCPFSLNISWRLLGVICMKLGAWRYFDFNCAGLPPSGYQLERVKPRVLFVLSCAEIFCL